MNDCNLFAHSWHKWLRINENWSLQLKSIKYQLGEQKTANKEWTEIFSFMKSPIAKNLIGNGSTVLGTPESVGMNGQIDWQALQISHLVCSLAGQRCSEAWGTFSAQTSQSITALTAWRKEEWRKEAADIPPSKAKNDLCSTRQILALFRGQPWGDC